MARRKARKRSRDWLFPQAAIATQVEPESSLLDVVDRVLNKGAVVHGELVLGVANVDLIYAKLSVLLAAVDRITNPKHKDPLRRREDPRIARRPTKNSRSPEKIPRRKK